MDGDGIEAEVVWRVDWERVQETFLLKFTCETARLTINGEEDGSGCGLVEKSIPSRRVFESTCVAVRDGKVLCREGGELAIFNKAE